MNKLMNSVIIVGATSGIGREVAKLFINRGWKVGVCGRREEKLLKLQQLNPKTVFIKVLDVTKEDAPAGLNSLIDEMDGLDLYLHVSGVGYQNKTLDPTPELQTVETNAKGFTRMIDTIFHYFELHPERKCHIACISSIAGTKGLGVSPAYSATKAYCNTYMEALEQLASIKGLDITFTDIRPGFVDTDLLKGDYKYPLMMKADKVAKDIVKGIERKRMIPKCLWVKLNIQ